MEFPVLNGLNLPETCIRLITQFAREPHPTAVLIKSLQFRRFKAGYTEILHCHYPRRLEVRGSMRGSITIRGRNMFLIDQINLFYDRLTGEQHIDDNDNDALYDEPGY